MYYVNITVTLRNLSIYNVIAALNITTRWHEDKNPTSRDLGEESDNKTIVIPARSSIKVSTNQGAGTSNSAPYQYSIETVEVSALACADGTRIDVEKRGLVLRCIERRGAV